MLDKLEKMGVKKTNVKLIKDGKTTDAKLEHLITQSFSPSKKAKCVK